MHARDATAAKRNPSRERLGVMIAEDEPLAVDFLQRTVNWESLGFTIVGIARTGAEALELHSSLRPDIVFVDMKLPQVSGIEVCSQIRLLDQRCRLVILSAYREFDYAREALLYGVSRYMLKHELDNAALRSLLQDIRDELMEFEAEQIEDRIDSGTLDTPRDELVRRIRNYIASAYGKSIGVPDIADHVGGSTSNVNRVFRDATGITLYQYLVEVRIVSARRLLRDTLKPVSEIGRLVGFASPQHFSRAFHARVGCSPSNYRSAKKRAGQ